MRLRYLRRDRPAVIFAVVVVVVVVNRAVVVEDGSYPAEAEDEAVAATTNENSSSVVRRRILLFVCLFVFLLGETFWGGVVMVGAGRCDVVCGTKKKNTLVEY